MRIPKPCLSVCPYPEKRNHPSFVNISSTLVIYASMERSSRVLHHENPKVWFFFQKFEIEFWLLPKSLNHHSFVNISSTLVIDASMERSPRVQHHGNPKTWFIIFFLKKFEIEFWLVFWPVLKSWNPLISFVNISPTLVIGTSMERSSQVLQHVNTKLWIYFLR